MNTNGPSDDFEYVVAAHAGELGACAKVAADGAITAAEEYGYLDDETRIAEDIKRQLAG